MPRKRNKPDSLFAAGWCLLALLLLQAPLAAAAWTAAGMACCAGNQCEAAGHHHSADSPPASTAGTAECGHQGQGRSSITACTMSCCHRPGHAMAASGLFLLPESALFAGPARAEMARTAAKPAELSFLLEPASPPPRTGIPVL
jgi:hypothetical protein